MRVTMRDAAASWVIDGSAHSQPLVNRLLRRHRNPHVPELLQPLTTDYRFESTTRVTGQRVGLVLPV
jgi:hypothetical protein